MAYIKISAHSQDSLPCDIHDPGFPDWVGTISSIGSSTASNVAHKLPAISKVGASVEINIRAGVSSAITARQYSPLGKVSKGFYSALVQDPFSM